jgi:hypothetical protein
MIWWRLFWHRGGRVEPSIAFEQPACFASHQRPTVPAGCASREANRVAAPSAVINESRQGYPNVLSANRFHPLSSSIQHSSQGDRRRGRSTACHSSRIQPEFVFGRDGERFIAVVAEQQCHGGFAPAARPEGQQGPPSVSDSELLVGLVRTRRQRPNLALGPHGFLCRARKVPPRVDTVTALKPTTSSVRKFRRLMATEPNKTSPFALPFCRIFVAQPGPLETTGP